MGLLRRVVNQIRQFITPSGDDPIKHVIVLMFENHSFDQMLGCFKSVYPGLEGVDPDNLRSNKDSKGNEFFQRESDDTVVDPDPRHELEHVLNQLKDGNSGFVSEYEKEYEGKNPDLQRIMDYFGMGELTALHELAKHFTICDYWYSSVPGPTWANRFFVHSGTSQGRVKMAETLVSSPQLYFGYDQATIYDLLNNNDNPRTWKVYYGDVPQSLMLEHQRSHDNRQNYDELEVFFEDAKGKETAFPEFAFIEPKYFHIPFEGPQNDDHPPHSTIPAQKLLADVYAALRSNDELWKSTLLVVLYDEHGGFYDHIEPPLAVRPDDFHREWTFDRLGVRVPALLVSPWVEQRVLSTPFDHTSLLKYLIEKWNLGSLTKRVDAANSIQEAISVIGEPRDVPKSEEMSATSRAKMMAAAPGEIQPEEELNDLQRSLIELSKFLESEVPAESRRKMMAAGPQTEAQKARQRVQAFLRHDRADLAPS